MLDYKKVHYFHESLNRSFESEMDDIFIRKGYTLREATKDEQKKGIDRELIKGDKKVFVDYKADLRVYDTGNFFIETLSNDVNGKKGWSEYTESKYIIYYMPKEKQLWRIELKHIQDRLKEWAVKYKTKECRNKTYSSWGLLIPRTEIEKLILERIHF